MLLNTDYYTVVVVVTTLHPMVGISQVWLNLSNFKNLQKRTLTFVRLILFFLQNGRNRIIKELMNLDSLRYLLVIAVHKESVMDWKNTQLFGLLMEQMF